MSLATAVAIYFIIWWVVLFAVLPFRVRSQEEEGGDVVRGTDPGAPVMARLWWKLLWTTVVAAVVFAICAVLYETRLVTFEGLSRLFGAGG